MSDKAFATNGAVNLGELLVSSEQLADRLEMLATMYAPDAETPAAMRLAATRLRKLSARSESAGKAPVCHQGQCYSSINGGSLCEQECVRPFKDVPLDELPNFGKHPRSQAAREASSAPSAGEFAHTDHPLRHFDRTCPACAVESANDMERRLCAALGMNEVSFEEALNVIDGMRESARSSEAVTSAEWKHLVEVARKEGFEAGKLSVAPAAPVAPDEIRQLFEMGRDAVVRHAENGPFWKERFNKAIASLSARSATGLTDALREIVNAHAALGQARYAHDEQADHAEVAEAEERLRDALAAAVRAADRQAESG